MRGNLLYTVNGWRDYWEILEDVDVNYTERRKYKILLLLKRLFGQTLPVVLRGIEPEGRKKTSREDLFIL